jgi:D-alanine transaminase
MRPAVSGILRGITRTVVLEVAAQHQIRVEERGFTVEEALSAREAFITAASTVVIPVVKIDGKPVGEGRPGPVAKALRASFHNVAEIAP